MCDHELDIFGDRALCCGPLRIKRYDALCDIIFHWFLLDNSDVRREQRCSSRSMTRPGDIFHLDFSLDKAAYFDISVRNSFTLSHLINAAINAAAAAEVWKWTRMNAIMLMFQVMAVCRTLLCTNHMECGLHIVWRC